MICFHAAGKLQRESDISNKEQEIYLTKNSGFDAKVQNETEYLQPIRQGLQDEDIWLKWNC